ncbi:hypothetical protein EV426DRAFT_591220 [Tirmania nivea]|nr:hypothetical protein EV426DRAFT_591220 [Tirmania nivea]
MSLAEYPVSWLLCLLVPNRGSPWRLRFHSAASTFRSSQVPDSSTGIAAQRPNFQRSHLRCSLITPPRILFTPY